ncbi:MAG: hypothetical protein PHT81_00885 [Endomicrobiaceae bacterium]|nr:hypothetical protein [Endomicrobiaceae bacterium]MDD3922434.1 hypothetical protein [Endomicrobiaceae bacterium]
MVLDLNSIYSLAWSIFKKNWWEYVLISLIMLVLMLFPLGGILQFFVMLLMINAILKALRGNEITFLSFFQFKEIWNSKVIIFVVALGIYSFFLQGINSIALSVVLTIIGFIISVIFFPILCVLIDKQFNIKETILYSAKLTKTIRGEILLIMAVNFIIGILGILLLFVGIFIAIPIITIVIVKTYLLLDDRFNSNINI